MARQSIQPAAASGQLATLLAKYLALEAAGLCRDLSKGDIAVYVVILSFMNKRRRESYPSMVLIGKRTGLSKSAIIECVARLQVYGFLDVRRDGRKNVYSIGPKGRVDLTNSANSIGSVQQQESVVQKRPKKVVSSTPHLVEGNLSRKLVTAEEPVGREKSLEQTFPAWLGSLNGELPIRENDSVQFSADVLGVPIDVAWEEFRQRYEHDREQMSADWRGRFHRFVNERGTSAANGGAEAA